MRTKTTYEEVIRGHRFLSYPEEAGYIMSLIESGRLIPIKASGTNGKKPAMYNRYWRVEKDKDYSRLIDELRYELYTGIDIDFYLRHPDIYEAERSYVKQLSDYLKENGKGLKSPVSVNERCFEIWRREKFLTGKKEDGNLGREILKHCGLDESDLNVYETSEPIAYYSNSKSNPQKLLILENLDPFFGMRMHLIDGNNVIFGTEVGTLIYGGGKRILKTFEQWETYAEPYMKDEGNIFLYFGDLDYEGILIYEGFEKRYGDRIRILPFVEAYERMLDGAGNLEELPKMKEQQNFRIGELFFSYFKGEVAERMKELLKLGKYIPQEILARKDYAV